MQNYLFVHFRETTTPDGEQVYFAISRDGFHWEALNDGRPVLWAYYGDKGVRDMTVVRDKNTGRFHIFATDLSLSYGMRGKYEHSWRNINMHGSKDLAHWWSDDLVHWSEQEMITLGDEKCGCIWAPDIIYDKEHEDYVLHWSYCHAGNNYGPMAIYYSRTKDFKSFSKPELLYRKEDSGCIDSAMYEEDGKYYLFVKSENNPKRMILLVSDHVTGPFTRVERFDESMLAVEEGLYEAPTAVRLCDGRWCLFIDYYGVRGAGQGYVPFVAPSMASGDFLRSDAAFEFPYGFKHGTILTITEEEFDRMKAHDWTDVEDKR
ncbi:MAG: glycoside hydrolase family 43 protein [Oscillospiraceae bacterium]|nr:glycoside hydrolase family 43 protein [Oscillospiraceae bacterium]